MTKWTLASQAPLSTEDSPNNNTRVHCHLFSRESSQPRNQTCLSCISGGFFTTEPPGKSIYLYVCNIHDSICCYRAYLVAQSEKAMATHSSTLAWKIPWTEEPGRLQSMGSLRVRHDWVTMVKNPPAMQEPQEMQLWSLGWEDPLVEEMATHSSILASGNPWTEDRGGLQSMELQRDTTEATEHIYGIFSTFLFLYVFH